ncbi:MAG: TPM domain-containing protein [Sphingomonadales bacterium]|nr:TPM domain-containing protein [Sphingomonadales bacterium]
MQHTRTLAAGVLLLLTLLLAPPALAQSFPELTGRVVDAANIIPADEKARLTQKLETLETQTHRQLVVVTLSDLQGYDIADYGYQLGRKWGIGTKGANDGALLIVAPTERKVRIEVGYGLEGVLTDGLSSLIIQQQIIPKFKAGDMPGGIEAGTNALVQQLSLPDDQARQNVAAAQAKAKSARNDNIPLSTLFWLLMFFLFFILPLIRRMRGGRSYGGGIGPVVIWPGGGWGGGGGGSGWGGGGDWGGGGGFSGGGGSFGGGGSSGSW